MRVGKWVEGTGARGRGGWAGRNQGAGRRDGNRGRAGRRQGRTLEAGAWAFCHSTPSLAPRFTGWGVRELLSTGVSSLSLSRTCSTRCYAAPTGAEEFCNRRFVISGPSEHPPPPPPTPPPPKYTHHCYIHPWCPAQGVKTSEACALPEGKRAADSLSPATTILLASSHRDKSHQKVGIVRNSRPYLQNENRIAIFVENTHENQGE